jgi:hypothetical protein
MLKAKRNEINEQGKEKKPANEMNGINEQGNEHVDHSKTIHEFINLFETEIFSSWFILESFISKILFILKSFRNC